MIVLYGKEEECLPMSPYNRYEQITVTKTFYKFVGKRKNFCLVSVGSYITFAI